MSKTPLQAFRRLMYEGEVIEIMPGVNEWYQLSEAQRESITDHLIVKWEPWGIKEKILCWLFPRQYPELVARKAFRKKLLCHYDFSNESTITKDHNNKVSKAADQTGNNHDLVQEVEDNQPSWLDAEQNSLDVIRFEGVEESEKNNGKV